MQKFITDLTLGIRFDRSFRLPDISGEIVDEILHDSKSPFSDGFFDRVRQSQMEKFLCSENGDEYLRINTDDVILHVKIRKDFQTTFEWLSNNVVTYLEKVFLEYHIKNIGRFGVVFSHEIPESRALSPTVSHLTGRKIPNPDEVKISFSKKEETSQALLLKGVNDYRNHIYSLRESENSTFADFDSQYYFNPVVEDLRDCLIQQKMTDAKKFLESEFYSWLHKYEQKTAD